MMLGMEGVSSECSSGCQSGWTMYFDHSSYSNSSKCKKANSFDRSMEQDEEEDLSMVSDASSGPSPLLHEDKYYGQQMTMHHNNNSNYNMNYEKKMKKKHKRPEIEKCKKKSSPSYLDDTASSPFFDYTKSYNGGMNPSMETVVDFSCAFSTNYFTEEPVYQNHFGYFQSSPLIKPIPQRPISKESGKKKMW